MSENENSDNNGCIIVGIVLLAIVGIYFFFKETDADSIAETGGTLLTIGGLAIAYFVCKALFGQKTTDTDNSSDTTSENNNSSKSTLGCILTGLACLVITIIILFSLTYSYDVRYIAGITFIVVFAIAIIGFFIYNMMDN